MSPTVVSSNHRHQNPCQQRRRTTDPYRHDINHSGSSGTTTTTTTTTSPTRCTMLVVVTVMVLMLGLGSPKVSAMDYSEWGEHTHTVTTAYGEVKGVTFPSQYSDYPHRWIAAFLGIPYAKRKAQYHGDEWKEKYRFHNPDDDPYWYDTYDATYHRPACPQMPWLVRETVPDFSHVSEDCLFLDIYMPRKTNERETANPSLYPVLVFLHGGGFIMGNSRQFPGVFLAERNLVVVIVNYRLNALGFFSTGDRYSPGNYGMFDQIKALQFVKKTIKSFRGNPNKVTLMGQDAGAASVGMHLVSPRSVDLFHKAIMLSGSEMSEWAVLSKKDSVAYAKKLCDRLGCHTEDSHQMVDCLRYRRFEEIVNASAMVAMEPGKIGNPWAPVIDGGIVGVNYAFLPDHPMDLRQQARQQLVPLLAGQVKDEGAYFIPNLPTLIDGVTENQFSNIIREFISYRGIKDLSTVQDTMEFQYTYWPQPNNETMIRKKLMEMMGDFMFGAAISETIRQHVSLSPVYFYVFEYSSWKNYAPRWRGVVHGQDLDYVFGMPFVNSTYRRMLGLYPRQEYEYPDRNISEYMINMITNFTSTGEPTPRSVDIRDFRNTTWYGYNIENHTYLSITNKSVNHLSYRMLESKFWNFFFPRMSGYFPYSTLKKSDTDPDKSETFELVTWALVATCGVLVIIVICLVIALIRRSRTKNYPKSPPTYDNSMYGSRMRFSTC